MVRIQHWHQKCGHKSVWSLTCEGECWVFTCCAQLASEEGGVFVQPLPLLGAEGVTAPPLCVAVDNTQQVTGLMTPVRDLSSTHRPVVPWRLLNLRSCTERRMSKSWLLRYGTCYTPRGCVGTMAAIRAAERHLAIHVVDLGMHAIRAVVADVEVIGDVIQVPGNPFPHHGASHIVVVGGPKQGVQQDVTAGQVATLHPNTTGMSLRAIFSVCQHGAAQVQPSCIHIHISQAWHRRGKLSLLQRKALCCNHEQVKYETQAGLKWAFYCQAATYQCEDYTRTKEPI